MAEPTLSPEVQQKIRLAVKKYLKSNGLTEPDLAQLMGLRPQSVINYLSTANITPKTVKKMAEALNYPYELLLRGEFYLGPNRIDDLERRIEVLERMMGIKE